ncbi:SWIM zinc finger family protein [Streptomyces sp. Li-HN-5-11]|uniref:SWIM zinc finger family protein n=1 Tax=Streptomyces sp. Li-HN-5-11 TaxID=3075432 RepID=UPI0028B16F6E|nr:SWIM zinc finger family protein [Streptomyces sp. Li-HN-5-11]WNM31194.1 SWIM zinc finger family protein [Streptomyces sp. Li-HN-5-11]
MMRATERTDAADRNGTPDAPREAAADDTPEISQPGVRKQTGDSCSADEGTSAGGRPDAAAPPAAEAPVRSGKARPGDVARRALREAREQRLPAGPPAGDEPASEEDSAERTARPGDVAREALRQAASVRRGEPAPGGHPSDVTVSDTAADPPAERSGAQRRPGGGRPADVAREALRAARARSETPAVRAPAGQTRTQQAATRTVLTGEEGERPARRSPDPRRLGRAVSGTRGGDADGRSREVPEPAADPAPGVPPAGSATSLPPRAPAHGPAPHDPSPGTGASTVPAAAPAARRTPPDAGTDSTTGGAPTPDTVAPHAARTMASPRRDGELRRTFPAFPARTREDSTTSGRSGFADTWWGNAWISALEEGALDAARLARGRGYAQAGHVDAITVTPGLVLAYVQGSRPRPYRVQVRLRTLHDADWDRFLDAAAERPGHIAALLDKEMPQSLADCGVPLLPGPGDLEPYCSCPDRGHPCKHAAALCYQTARLLDADPFVLLLLRGRGERELLDALSRLSATRAARAAQDREPEQVPGVRAGDALAPRRLPPLPAPLPPPPHPGQPPVYPAAPGGPDPFALDQLATDAAARAHALLTTGRDPVGGLTLWQDAVRLAAARPGSGLTAATRSLYASLASAAGRTPAELARAVAAWRQGGPAGLAVLEEPWDPPAGRFDRARPLLLAADLPAFRPRRNRLTHPHGQVQLRLGRDGLWYAYESEAGREDWWPRGTPDLDPVGALTGMGTSGAL